MKYKLPCTCGKHLEIDVSQAGQTLRCGCGNKLEVPAMRDIRQLEPIRRQSDVPPRRARWSILQRVLFVTGLLLAVIGTTFTGYYQWIRMRLDVEETAWDVRLDPTLRHFETMTINQAWTHWLNVRDDNIGPYNPPPFVRNRFVSAGLLTYIKRTSVLAGVGLVAMVVAFFLPRPSAGKPRRPQKRPPRR